MEKEQKSRKGNELRWSLVSNFAVPVISVVIVFNVNSLPRIISERYTFTSSLLLPFLSMLDSFTNGIT